MGGLKVRVGNNPTKQTVVREIPPTPVEVANGERPIEVRNDKTGETQIVDAKDITPITERPAEAKTPKRDLDAELRAAGMDPTVFPDKASKEAALKRGKRLGPGAEVLGEPKKAELAQLTDSIRSMAESNDAHGMGKAFSLGRVFGGIKDAASSAADGLLAAGQYAKMRLEGFPTWTSWKSMLGDRHLALSESVHNAREFARLSTKAVPDAKTQEAISDWIDAGGDLATLQRAEAETKPRYKAGYKQAQNLTPDQIKVAENIRNYFDSRLQQAQDAGILEEGIENYIHRFYESETPWKRGAIAELRSGIFTGKPALAKSRAFTLDLDAEKAGLKPVKSFIKRVAAYDLALNKAIADRQAVKAMMGMRMPDGRPMIDVAGIGTPIETTPGKTDATLIKPSVKRTNANDPANHRGDYRPYDYPALRKWKWVTKDSAGNDIFVQGDVLVHPDAIKQVRTLFENSAIRRNPIGRAALGTSSAIKQTMLDLSGFHQVQIGVHGFEHRTFKPVEKIDFENPDVRGLVRGGMVVGETRGHELFSEGLSGSSVTRLIPILGDKLQAYHEWLFQSYIPRLKVSTGLHALERNRQRFKNLSQDELYHLTANEMNAAFGELNYEMLGRSKTMQDALRLGLLAPDFLEARTRFVAQAGTKYGREQLSALALGAGTLYLTARIINKLLNDEYHFEPKNAFSIIHNNHAYSLRTVQGDVLHFATEPGRFVFNRLNPVYGRTAMEFLTGRDAFGRKRTYGEQLKDLATTAVPISLRGLVNPREQKLWESLLNSIGVTEKRYTASDTITKLAQDFKKSKGRIEPGEFIYDAERDPYRPIKLALMFGDPQKAAQEIANVISEGRADYAHIHEHFKNYGKRPFSGSVKDEPEFVKSLTQDQRKVYQDALKERERIRRDAQQAISIYNSVLKK